MPIRSAARVRKRKSTIFPGVNAAALAIDAVNSRTAASIQRLRVFIPSPEWPRQEPGTRMRRRARLERRGVTQACRVAPASACNVGPHLTPADAGLLIGRRPEKPRDCCQTRYE